MKKPLYCTLIAALHLISFLLLSYGATAYNVNLLDQVVKDGLGLDHSLTAVKSIFYLAGIVGLYATLHILVKEKYKN